MPIYVYRCPECGREREEIRRVADMDLPVECNCSKPIDAGVAFSRPLMVRAPTTASFGFKTAGGNFSTFSGSHGPSTKGSRRVPVIGRGHGLGGHRKFDRSKVVANPIPEAKS